MHKQTDRRIKAEQPTYVSSHTLQLTSSDLICVRANLLPGTG